MPNVARSLLLILLAVCVGGLCYFVTEWFVPPSLDCFSYGKDYQALSADPLALGGQLPHRILGPALAFALGLGGPMYPQFMRLCGALLLMTVFWFCGRRGSFIDALLITIGVAVTGALQTYRSVVGFPDQLSFAMLLLAVAAVRRPVLFFGINFLSLCNHEVLLFLVPWLLWHRRLAGARFWQDLIGLSVIGALYVAFRFFISMHVAQATLDANWYAGKSLFPLGTLWLWLLSFGYWVIDFGPMLAIVAFAAFSRSHGQRIALLLFVGGIFAIYSVVYVYDFFRFGSALCVPLVLASICFLQPMQDRTEFALREDEGVFWRRLFYLALIVGTAFACAAWHPGAGNILLRPEGYALAFDMDRITLMCCVDEAGNLDFKKAFTCVVPKIWPQLAMLSAELIALTALGGLLARFAPRRLLKQI
ncbi:MAG: hypothetical protein EXS02_14850 [Planctomycetes bacterium]|nr:hypothetical protein [Planctomycetota bacterium]